MAGRFYLGGCNALSLNSHFCGGGLGYTLNVVAHHLLVEVLMSTPDCHPLGIAPEDDGAVICLGGFQGFDNNHEKLETWYLGKYVELKKRQAAHVELENFTRLRFPQHYQQKNFTRLRFPQHYQQKEGLRQISERRVSFHLKTISSIHDDS